MPHEHELTTLGLSPAADTIISETTKALRISRGAYKGYFRGNHIDPNLRSTVVGAAGTEPKDELKNRVSNILLEKARNGQCFEAYRIARIIDYILSGGEQIFEHELDLLVKDDIKLVLEASHRDYLRNYDSLDMLKETLNRAMPPVKIDPSTGQISPLTGNLNTPQNLQNTLQNLQQEPLLSVVRRLRHLGAYGEDQKTQLLQMEQMYNYILQATFCCDVNPHDPNQPWEAISDRIIAQRLLSELVQSKNQMYARRTHISRLLSLLTDESSRDLCMPRNMQLFSILMNFIIADELPESAADASSPPDLENALILQLITTEFESIPVDNDTKISEEEQLLDTFKLLHFKSLSYDNIEFIITHLLGMGCKQEDIVALCKQYINEYKIPETEYPACFGILQRVQSFRSGGESKTLVELLGGPGSIESGSSLFKTPNGEHSPSPGARNSGGQHSTQTYKS